MLCEVLYVLVIQWNLQRGIFYQRDIELILDLCDCPVVSVLFCGEFWSVKFIETRDFFQSLFRCLEHGQNIETNLSEQPDPHAVTEANLFRWVSLRSVLFV